MGLEVCIARLADSLEPPPRQTVSEWADQNRRLSSEASAERGEWRTDRAPYQRAIMDALSPYSPYERIVVMDLYGDLRQPVKTQNPSKGKLSHGLVEKDVHQGVQAGRGAALGARGVDRGSRASAGGESQRVAPLAA